VRMATRRNTDGNLEGYVVAFDDVTDLVTAQRMAAWGDVARRIAHEIKNPLTPIQLSAERIKRKFAARCCPRRTPRRSQMTA
jgi:two-component system nitrogen regulation sensor histidine kinase NtrY